jgi:DNA-binding LacI/PurR family transcriptional regulator
MTRTLTSRPTIIDVAARAGVSKSLVSLVMRGVDVVSDEKRRRVLEAAAELGYRPNAAARSLVRRRTNLLGIVLSDLHNPFFAEVIDGVEAAAGGRGYRTIISTVDRHARREPEKRALDTLLELRVDGLILASPMLALDTIAAVGQELPVVLVARRSAAENVDSVSNDDPTGATLVVEHLTSLGHERIAHIDGGGGAGAVDRRGGYERAMRERGLGAHARVIPGSYTDEGGRHGIAALFDGVPDAERPTAVFVANDLAALGALSALAERGLRVPDDVSLVGYDNTALAAVSHIDLTTVDQPRPDMGRTAVTLVLERLTGKRDTARHVVIPPTLVVRGTTAPPRGRAAGHA